MCTSNLRRHLRLRSSESLPVGRLPPEDPDFFIGWGKENAKEFIKNANAALGQLLTLSTTLLGGAIAFWENIPLNTTYKYAVVSLLLVTVLVCLFSAMPTEGRFDPKNAADVRRHMEELFAYKRSRLRIAKLTLTLSLIVMTGGLVGSTSYMG